MEYKVYTYDLWGNERDGFEVNDVYGTDLIAEINEDMTDKQIIQELKGIGLLKKTCKDSEFHIYGDFNYELYIEYPEFKPLCELRLIND
jgi:hypothetical protein